MGDRMTPIPFGNLMDWILTEYQERHSIFGIRRFYRADRRKWVELFGERMEAPFGPAAGPHTQLAQNIISAYVTGSRFFELKTVQVLDGEDLPVAKPCILAEEEGYNCEWSTELRVPEAGDEYIKAWIALKVLAKEYGFGSPDGFLFNMSVGYDLKGIQSEKIDRFMEQMREAGSTPVWKESIRWLYANIHRFTHVTLSDVEKISSRICRSVTVSTLHGCPPQEIFGIASYLMKEKGFHTFVKCNPTLLGYETARELLDSMGYGYISFGDFHFKDDLQFQDAVPMLERLRIMAKEKGLVFGVKITNTFPVDVTKKELPGEEMYMSGKALCALSLSVAYKLSEAFDGKLRISYSGGADYFNIDRIVALGIWPVTAATTFLKPGGYQRGIQMAEKLTVMEYGEFQGVDVAGLGCLIEEIKQDPYYRKEVKPLLNQKLAKKVPLLECFTAPCSHGCPIHQDIPAYIRLAGEGNYEEALWVILDKNPLPFITGTICNHRCMDKCTRNFYEESVRIRDVKLTAAQGGYEAVKKELERQTEERRIAACEAEEGAVLEKSATGRKAAVVGGGPAGIAAAHFLAKAGVDVTVFEKTDRAGGVVAQVIPDFRITEEDIEKDIALAQALGVKFLWNHPVTDLLELKSSGFEAVFAAVGASRAVSLGIPTEREYNAVEFLGLCKNQPDRLSIGKHVAVVGAGNTAMDAARAALRLSGVEKVSVVYRRTRQYMPADEEELKLALLEGVEFLELLAPRYQKDGLLVCNRVVLGKMDESGRQRPVITREEVAVPADTVVAALGEQVDGHYYKVQGLAVDERGKPLLSEAMESSKEGIYVIGDGAGGPATVVEAICDAWKAVNHFLAGMLEYAMEGKTDVIEVTDGTEAYARKGILCHSGGNSEEDMDGVQQAAGEAQRCLACDHVCENCVDVCPNRANVAVRISGSPMPVILHIDGMCNECGNCRSFCPYDSAPYKEKFTFFSNEADFADSGNDGFLILNCEEQRVKFRIAGDVTEEVVTDPDCRLQKGLKDVISAVTYHSLQSDSQSAVR